MMTNDVSVCESVIYYEGNCQKREDVWELNKFTVIQVWDVPIRMTV